MKIALEIAWKKLLRVEYLLFKDYGIFRIVFLFDS